MNDGKEYKCEFCGRILSRLASLTYHTKYCKCNPNRVFESAETKEHKRNGQLKRFEDPSERQKMSDRNKKRFEDPKARAIISESNKRRFSNLENRHKQSEAMKSHFKDLDWKTNWQAESKKARNRPGVEEKIYDSKKKNGSFNSSKIEERLKDYFDSNGIEYIYQYKSEVYPFMCDFYFPSKDLYVEIQGMWTHGGRPFNSEDVDCVSQLKRWKDKSTQYYKIAIDTWTKRDVKKRETAKATDLNWVEIFSTDLNECLDIILKLL